MINSIITLTRKDKDRGKGKGKGKDKGMRRGIIRRGVVVVVVDSGIESLTYSRYYRCWLMTNGFLMGLDWVGLR